MPSGMTLSPVPASLTTGSSRSRQAAMSYDLGRMPITALLLLISPAVAWPQTDLLAQQSEALDRTEAVASYVGAVLGRFDTSYRTSGDPLSDKEAMALFDEDARASLSGEAAEAEAAWSGAINVVDAPERPLVLDEDTGPLDAMADVRDAFMALEASIGGKPTRELEFAVKSVLPVEGSPDVYDVRARVRAVRMPNAEAFARWTSRWRVVGDRRELLGLSASVIRTVERSEVGAVGGFVDVAGSLLTGPTSTLLAPSIMQLRERHDTDVGVGILGHHGVTVADVNGDGIDDLYLCQPGGVPNQLWVRTAEGGAANVAAAGGLDLLDATTSALFVDFDGDGDRDVALALANGVRIFARTDRAFEEVASFDRDSVTALSAADVDGDGLLDLYVCAYADPYQGSTFPEPYHDAENGQANVLLLNRTTASDALKFADETAERGLAPGAKRYSFAATFEDIDSDGDADLYVANDFGRNALYVNDGAGHFVERAAEAGVQDVAAGMAAAFADFNRDGIADLYVANMESSAGRRVTATGAFRPDVDGLSRSLFQRHAKGNTMYLGRGDGTFEESRHAENARWAWGALPIDLDGDGSLDLYVPNGFMTGAKSKAPDL